ncbi:MAG: tyrosine recombinase XerC [Prevotella sp.]|jgi:integrase/recombinase XerC|nr:tyrosine recombinase XerC [Prevotella sp.]
MIEQFLNYLRLERNYSQRTVDSYGKDLRAFETHFKNLEGHLSWTTVDADVIRDWMEQMMDKGNSATSINRRLSALRSFFRYALKKRLVTSDPAHAVVGPKKEKPLPMYLKEREMDSLLDEQEWGTGYKDVLARTILIIFYETGVRISELIGLNEADVNFVTHELKVTGKRNKQRVIPFGKELEDTLTAYLELRNALPSRQTDALLVSSKGERLKDPTVRTMVKKHLSTVSTLKKRSPHVLRHTFATAMLNHEAGLESVQKLLGHESLATTEIYTHTTFEQLKKVYKTAHPRG